MTPELDKAVKEFKDVLSVTPPFNWPLKVLESGYGIHVGVLLVTVMAIVISIDVLL